MFCKCDVILMQSFIKQNETNLLNNKSSCEPLKNKNDETLHRHFNDNGKINK